jgi:hypothetical protein
MNLSSNTSTSTADNNRTSSRAPATEPLEHIPSTSKNSCEYPLFDMQLVPSYTNNQIIYYFTTRAIPTAKQNQFQQLMKKHKASLNLISWDGASDRDNMSRDHSKKSESLENSNSDCPVPPPDHKRIKISAADIPKLAYSSTVAQYKNWLANLKTGFDEDLTRFSTSYQKIILASIILNKQLKIIFNSAVENSSILLQHWRKFKH